jgi:hypothetical protein
MKHNLERFTIAKSSRFWEEVGPQASPKRS